MSYYFDPKEDEVKIRSLGEIKNLLVEAFRETICVPEMGNKPTFIEKIRARTERGTLLTPPQTPEEEALVNKARYDRFRIK